MFSDERTPSRSFCRWDLFAMVETQGSCEKGVQRVGREESSHLIETGGHPVIARLVQTGPFGEVNRTGSI